MKASSSDGFHLVGSRAWGSRKLETLAPLARPIGGCVCCWAGFPSERLSLVPGRLLSESLLPIRGGRCPGPLSLALAEQLDSVIRENP